MPGLLAFAGGILWIMATASVGKSWTSVVGPLFLIGLGVGCTFTPMANEVMRNVPPKLTGAASGVNNALRQVGSVLAGAVIGAILQSQLVLSLRNQAQQRAAAVPPPYRTGFIQSFAQSGKNGLQIGVGQTGTTGHLPASVPHDVALRIHDIADQIFRHGFIDAMRPTMAVSAAVMLLGAIACLAVKGIRGASANPHGLPIAGDDSEAEGASLVG